MAITVEEAYDSRPLQLGQSPSHTRSYIVRGSSDEAACAAALLAYAPATANGQVRLNYAVNPVHVDTLNEATCRWSGVVTYGLSQYSRPATGDSRFSFDTSGGTQHITQAIAELRRYTAPGYSAAEDYEGAINVGQDGTVQGCDKVVPVFKWQETHYVDNDDVNESYISGLADLTGKVNDAAFRINKGATATYPAGEVLFLGASGSARDDDDWEITFNFARSPNLTGVTIGTITGVAKGGWEYLWVLYKPAKGANWNKTIPVAAYVDQVYYSGDFSGLGG